MNSCWLSIGNRRQQLRALIEGRKNVIRFFGDLPGNGFSEVSGRKARISNLPASGLPLDLLLQISYGASRFQVSYGISGSRFPMGCPASDFLYRVRGPPLRRSEEGGIPMLGGQNRLVPLVNTTQNLD